MLVLILGYLTVPPVTTPFWHQCFPIFVSAGFSSWRSGTGLLLPHPAVCRAPLTLSPPPPPRAVTERTRENEVAKMARLKRGLLTLSDAYLQLADRTQLVFRAHRDIVSELPDLDAAQLHTAKFTGTCGALIVTDVYNLTVVSASSLGIIFLRILADNLGCPAGVCSVWPELAWHVQN